MTPYSHGTCIIDIKTATYMSDNLTLKTHPTPNLLILLNLFFGPYFASIEIPSLKTPNMVSFSARQNLVSSFLGPEFQGLFFNLNNGEEVLSLMFTCLPAHAI